MEFKTIYIFSDYENTLEKEIKKLSNKKGILIVNGYSLDINNKIPRTLVATICSNISLFADHLYSEFLKNKYRITNIDYKECEDDIENCRIFLNIVKNLNPILIFTPKINAYLEKLQIKNFDNYTNAKFENLDKKVFFNESYISKTELEKIPNTTGIYFMYNENKELMYIGKTIHLNSRVTDHLAGRTHTSDICHNFNYIKYIEIDNETLLDDYETYFINSYKPKLNVSKVQTYHSERYDTKYNKNLNEFFDLEHMLRYRFAKEYLEYEWNISKLIAEREEEMLKDIAAMKDLFL